jgi:hypothetical protein
MRRGLTWLVAGLLITAVPLATGASWQSDPHVNESTPGPGPAVAGVIGEQGATVDGAIRVQTVNQQLEAATTPSERAHVIARTVERTRGPVDRLKEQFEQLQAARDSGSIDEQTYVTRLGVLAARAHSLQDVTERLQVTASDIDSATLREAGVSREQITTLDERLEPIVTAGDELRDTGALDPSFYRHIGVVAAAYNDVAAERDLGLLGTYLSGERVNLHVVTSDGDTEMVSFRTTETTQVRELRAGPHPDATVRVTISESTARQVLGSEDPVVAANEALLSGAIELDGFGTLNAVRWLVISVVVGTVQVLLGIADALSTLLR